MVGSIQLMSQKVRNKEKYDQPNMFEGKEKKSFVNFRHYIRSSWSFPQKWQLKTLPKSHSTTSRTVTGNQ